MGGPFADRSGGLITFRADNDEQAQQAVATDPFIREGSFRGTGSSSGRPSEICAEAAMTDRLGGDRLAGLILRLAPRGTVDDDQAAAGGLQRRHVRHRHHPCWSSTFAPLRSMPASGLPAPGGPGARTSAPAAGATTTRHAWPISTPWTGGAATRHSPGPGSSRPPAGNSCLTTSSAPKSSPPCRSRCTCRPTRRPGPGRHRRRTGRGRRRAGRPHPPSSGTDRRAQAVRLRPRPGLPPARRPDRRLGDHRAMVEVPALPGAQPRNDAQDHPARPCPLGPGNPCVG